MTLISTIRLVLLEMLGPIISRLPRFDRFFYWRIGGEYTSPAFVWPYKRIRIKRCWRHRYLMAFDMTQELHRRAFYTGRYYERDVPQLVWEITRPGDCFIDIGANVGHICLLAARRVGPSGHVIVFEPNPEARTLLTVNKVMNSLEFLTIREEALGDVTTVAELRVNKAELGQCTLRDVRADHTTTVKIAKGEDILAGLVNGRPTIIKIDVEGFEMKVLLGLGSLLNKADLVVIVEVTDSWLRQLGSSWPAMRSMMSEVGFEAFRIAPSRTWIRPNGVQLQLASADNDDQLNIVFVRSNGPMYARLSYLCMNGACK